MRAGPLRHRIIIQTKDVTKESSFGGESVQWSSNVGAWADFRPLRGRQYAEASQVHASATHTLTMRYMTLSASTAIRPGYCRALFGDRVLTIHHVTNLEERNYKLEMMVSEEI